MVKFRKVNNYLTKRQKYVKMKKKTVEQPFNYASRGENEQ